MAIPARLCMAKYDSDLLFRSTASSSLRVQDNQVWKYMYIVQVHVYED